MILLGRVFYVDGPSFVNACGSDPCPTARSWMDKRLGAGLPQLQAVPVHRPANVPVGRLARRAGGCGVWSAPGQCLRRHGSKYLDQRGTTHVYAFDALGRQTQDRVTVLGSGVDGAVRRIQTGHEARGMRQRVTRCDGVTAVTGSPLPAPPPDTIG